MTFSSLDEGGVSLTNAHPVITEELVLLHLTTSAVIVGDAVMGIHFTISSWTMDCIRRERKLERTRERARESERRDGHAIHS